MMEPLEKLINNTLALDARAPQLLKKLNQKIIKIQIREFNFFALIIGFNEKGLHFLTEREMQAEEYLQVSGTAMSFAALLFTKDPLVATKLGLTMQGDMETAQNLQTLFLYLDIDWEELVAKYSNDTFAFYFGRFFKSFKKRQKAIAESLTQSMKEYVQEEARITPSPQAFDNFVVELEELIEDCERLEARINLVSEKTGKAEVTKKPENVSEIKQTDHENEIKQLEPEDEINQTEQKKKIEQIILTKNLEQMR